MRRTKSLGAVYILVVIAIATAGCTKKKEEPASSTSSSGSGAGAPSSTEPAPGPNTPKTMGSGDLARCTGCTNPVTSVHWMFTGSYRDAKCTEPLATADVQPCQVVSLPAKAQVRFSEVVGTHKKAETSEIALKPIPAAETQKTYKKADDGSCVAVTSGFKVVPDGCDGKRVCLDANKKLTCNASECASLPNNCPQFETARMLATFTP